MKEYITIKFGKRYAVTVEPKQRDYFTKKIEESRINWAAYGSRDVKFAKMFMKTLQKAIKVAESKNKVPASRIKELT